MRVKSLMIVVLFFILGCERERVQPQIYDYQVERLLSGQTGSKTWDKVVNSLNCQDSIKLSFELVEVDDVDSLEITEMQYLSDCSIEEIAIGRANASKAAGRDVFTDSIVFDNGNYWLVDQITSELFSYTDQEDQRFIYRVKR